MSLEAERAPPHIDNRHSFRIAVSQLC